MWKCLIFYVYTTSSWLFTTSECQPRSKEISVHSIWPQLKYITNRQLNATKMHCFPVLLQYITPWIFLSFFFETATGLWRSGVPRGLWMPVLIWWTTQRRLQPARQSGSLVSALSSPLRKGCWGLAELRMSTGHTAATICTFKPPTPPPLQQQWQKQQLFPQYMLFTSPTSSSLMWSYRSIDLGANWLSVVHRELFSLTKQKEPHAAAFMFHWVWPRLFTNESELRFDSFALGFGDSK